MFNDVIGSQKLPWCLENYFVYLLNKYLKTSDALKFFCIYSIYIFFLLLNPDFRDSIKFEFRQIK